MKKYNGVTWSFLALLAVAKCAMVIFSSAENELYAAVSTRNLSVTCVSPAVRAFAPGVSYTITIPSGTSAEFLMSGITATAVLTLAVNNDANPSVGLTAGPTTDVVVLYNAAPRMKIGGVQCTANSTSKLEMYGDGSDDSNLDVAVAAPGTTAWGSATTVDNKVSGTAVVLFGSGGVVLGQALNDGNDNDGIVNGEIVFGGGGAAVNGGFQMLLKVRIFGVNPDNTSETISVKFTSA